MHTHIIFDKDMLTDTSRVDNGESISLNQGVTFDLEQAQVVKVSWNKKNKTRYFETSQLKDHSKRFEMQMP